MRQAAGGALRRRDDAVARVRAVLHQLAGAAQVAEARQMTRRHYTDAETLCFPELREPDSGLDAVDVQDVGTLVGEPAEQVLGPGHRDAVIGLVACRMGVDRIPNTGTPW